MKRKFTTRLPSLVLALCILCLLCAPAALAAPAPRSAPLALTEDEQAYLASHPTLRVGFVQDRIPVSFTGKDGQFAGISRYVLDRLAQLAGFTFEYIPLPAGSITYDFLNENRLDLVTSVEYNRENLNARGILMSEPYLTSRKVVVARQGLEFSYDAHHTVAISTGSQTLRKVLAETYPNFQVVDYDSITDCFEAVNSGKADLLIQNQYVVEYWISKPSYEKLKVIPVLNTEDELCFSAIVSFDGGPGTPEEEGRVMIAILNKAIAAMTEDEVGACTVQGVMENQYEYTLSDTLYRYRVAVSIFAASAVIIIILAILLTRQHIRSLAAQSDAKAKGEFLSAMSHEIRTPLNGLLGLNYLMSQDPGDRERLDRYLKQSAVTAKYLLCLVTDILDMSRLQDQQLELLREPVDLDLIVSTSENMVRGTMEEKGLRFQVRRDLPFPWILGDEFRIQQVLMNLLDNARKFTPSGGWVELAASQEPTEGGKVLVTFEVADNGQGMSEDFQAQVFDSFAQERETVSKGNQGTGLGLPISRNLARLMGGDITFTSRKNAGSRFFFTFTAETAQPREPSEAVAPVPQEKPRILVAEDNELNGEIMVELLESEDYEVTLAHDGQEALEIFSASAPGTYGVILMDILMPRLDGYQTTAAIRALPRPDAKSVRVIACTANSWSEEHDRVTAAGMDDFIAKPVDIDELLQKLRGPRQ